MSRRRRDTTINQYKYTGGGGSGSGSGSGSGDIKVDRTIFNEYLKMKLNICTLQ